jgi:hypothetical protein
VTCPYADPRLDALVRMPENSGLANDPAHSLPSRHGGIPDHQ